MRTLALLWIAAGCCLALGCGDSDGGGGKDAAVGEDAGHDAGKPPPFMPIDSGSMTPEPMEFMCEETMCTVPELDVSSLPPIMGFEITPELIASMGFGPMGCCVDSNKCGVTQEMLFGAGFCSEQNQAGEPDTECPDEAADVMGLITINLVGCCRTDNKCGVDLDLIGVGCVEREEASMIQIMGMSLPNADMITELPCVSGAGMSDAGM